MSKKPLPKASKRAPPPPPARKKSNEQLSGGAIAGIVIGTLILVIGIALLIVYFVVWGPSDAANSQKNSGKSNLLITRADSSIKIKEGKYITDISWIVDNIQDTDGFEVITRNPQTGLILDSVLVPSTDTDVSLQSSSTTVPPYNVEVKQFLSDGSTIASQKQSRDVGSNGAQCQKQQDCVQGSVCNSVTGRCICDPKVKVDRIFLMAFTNGTVVAWHDYRKTDQAGVNFECNLFYNGEMVGSKTNIIHSNIMFDFVAEDVQKVTAEVRSTINCGSTMPWTFHVGSRFTLNYPNELCNDNCICAFGYCANSMFDCPYPQVAGLMVNHAADHLVVAVRAISTSNSTRTWQVTLQSRHSDVVKGSITPIVQILQIEPMEKKDIFFSLPKSQSLIDPRLLQVEFINMDELPGSPCAQPLIVDRLLGCSNGLLYPFYDLSIQLEPVRTGGTAIRVKAEYDFSLLDKNMQEIKLTGISSELQPNGQEEFSIEGGSILVSKLPERETEQEREIDNVPDDQDQEFSFEPLYDRFVENDAENVIEHQKETYEAKESLNRFIFNNISHIIYFTYKNRPIGNLIIKPGITETEMIVPDVPCDNPSAIGAILKTVSPCPEPTSMSLDIGFLTQGCADPSSVDPEDKNAKLFVEKLWFVADLGEVWVSWQGWDTKSTNIVLFYHEREIDRIDQPENQNVEIRTDFVGPDVHIDVRALSVLFENTDTGEVVKHVVYQCVTTAILRPGKEVSRYLSQLALITEEVEWWKFFIIPAKTPHQFAEIQAISNADRPLSEVFATYYVLGNSIGVDDVQEDTESFYVTPFRFQNCQNSLARGITAAYMTRGACNTSITNMTAKVKCVFEKDKPEITAETRSPELAEAVLNPYLDNQRPSTRRENEIRQKEQERQQAIDQENQQTRPVVI